MADAAVETRPAVRFFCHRCSIEFEDVLQDYTCPYCAGGFIEQLDSTTEGLRYPGADFSDADMSNLEDMSNIDNMSGMDDSDDVHPSAAPVLNDLAFLMSGGRLPGNTSSSTTSNSSSTAPQPPGAPRRHTLMEELVWMIGGARPGTGAVTAGAPFVFVGAPGDYVFGGEGLDAVVTQLLGQLENAGPPPLPRERLAALPDEPVSEEQAAANVACSVCWDVFALGETICRLECEHIFHSACIRPWLQLHATCPICRRSLLPAAPPHDPAAAAATTTTTTNPTNAAQTNITARGVIHLPVFAVARGATSRRHYATQYRPRPRPPPRAPDAPVGTSIAAALPRILLRRIVQPATRPRPAADTSSTSSSSSNSTNSPNSTNSTNSTTSVASVVADIERHYNMDLDMD